jgi:hypothetical protein
MFRQEDCVLIEIQVEPVLFQEGEIELVGLILRRMDHPEDHRSVCWLEQCV